MRMTMLSEIGWDGPAGCRRYTVVQGRRAG